MLDNQDAVMDKIILKQLLTTMTETLPKLLWINVCGRNECKCEANNRTKNETKMG